MCPLDAELAAAVEALDVKTRELATMEINLKAADAEVELLREQNTLAGSTDHEQYETMKQRLAATKVNSFRDEVGGPPHVQVTSMFI